MSPLTLKQKIGAVMLIGPNFLMFGVIGYFADGWKGAIFLQGSITIIIMWIALACWLAEGRNER